jgi:hypothetical protein
MTESSFRPVPLPDPGIPGYAFPEPERKVLDWANSNDQRAINNHAWGIWTALTSTSHERYQGQELFVYETWETPEDILGGTLMRSVPRTPRPIAPLDQFAHIRALELRAGETAHGRETVLGFVKYDPSAAQHARRNDLFSRVALQGMLDKGQTSIPAFPDTAVTLKSVYHPLGTGALEGKAGLGVTSAATPEKRYFMLANWPGPVSPPAPFPSTQWKQCVWVDVQDDGPGPGTGAVDTTCDPNGASRVAAATYGIGRFIHYRLGAGEAAQINQQRAEQLRAQEIPGFATVQGGDVSILVAMHVTSRETLLWTWQTFWWVPNPDAPLAPSSKEIAAERPAQLLGAARSYAHCNAYSTLQPPQPSQGGSNVGAPVYCYNPWLEAGFGPTDLPDSKPLTDHGVTYRNDVGIQTNCMSCHAQASYAPRSVPNPPNYTGDSYIDLGGSEFKGTLQVDFAWSIPTKAR